MARRLALALRHAPEKFNLEMDINGWIDVKDMIKQFKGSNEKRYHWLRPHHFRAISETDPKGRYEVRGNVMRATYAHTVEIELDLPTDNIPEALYYPCSPDECDNLLELGVNQVVAHMCTCRHPFALQQRPDMFTIHFQLCLKSILPGWLLRVRPYGMLALPCTWQTKLQQSTCRSLPTTTLSTNWLGCTGTKRSNQRYSPHDGQKSKSSLTEASQFLQTDSFDTAVLVTLSSSTNLTGESL